MNTLAQLMLIFTTATNTTALPSRIEMEAAANAALHKHELVAADPLFGIRNMDRDTLRIRVGHKDESDTPLTDGDVTSLLNDVAAKSGCALTHRANLTAPTLSDGATVSIRYLPYYHVEFACGAR